MSLLAAFPLAVQTSLAKTLREAAIRDGVSLAQLLAATRISGTDQEQERIFGRLLNALDDFDVVELWLGTLGSAWLSSGSALRVLEMIQGGVSTRHQEVESVEFTGEDEEAELEAVLCKVEICLPGLPESASHNAGSSTVPIGTSVGTDAELASSRAARAPARARARAARCAVATTHAAAAAAATAAASTPPPASAVAPSATPVSGEDQEHGSGLYDVDVRVGLCGWPPGPAQPTGRLPPGWRKGISPNHAKKGAFGVVKDSRINHYVNLDGSKQASTVAAAWRVEDGRSSLAASPAAKVPKTEVSVGGECERCQRWCYTAAGLHAHQRSCGVPRRPRMCLETLHVGQRVMARFQATTETQARRPDWFGGVVHAKHENDSTVDIKYEDGDFEERVILRHVRHVVGSPITDAGTHVPSGSSSQSHREDL